MNVPEELKFKFNRNKPSMLDEDELNALKSVGILAENWFAICVNKNAMPLAIFKDEKDAIKFASPDHVVEPWPMIIRDYR
jgi:hypothetical protein